ncbi:FAD-dependent oxidoreductase [Thermodesulfobacteriota bacterium]
MILREGENRVSRVITDKRELETDMVIMALGVTPNSDLAKDAGLKISSSGAVKVDKYMRTSDPDIYSGGDCVEVTNLITGRPGYWPLGSLANRQGRVIGTNLADGKAVFDGAVGSFIIKLFDLSVACTGLSLDRAQKEGFDAINAFIVQLDRAHFYPDKDLLYLELTVEKDTARVLGIQGLGGMDKGLMARISAVASILKYEPKVQDISNLELPYSPPFSAAMDIVNALGNTAENILAGTNRVIDADKFADWWVQRDKGDVCYLDCREWGNARPFVEKYPECWKNIPQGELKGRIDEVPKDKKIVLICNTGARSYEAQIELDQEGIKDTHNLQGGMAALNKWGLTI